MGSDQLIELLSQVAYRLLPIAGVVLLVYLILFVKELIVTMKALSATLKTSEEQIRKLDQPLETLEDVSLTVDKIHNASKGAIAKSVTILKDNFEAMKQKKAEKNDSKEDENERT